MDYALCQALKNTMTSEEKRVIFVYDINCQYMVKLMARIKCGVKHLWIWPDLFLVPGIGLFHVHGHQEIYAFHDLPQHLSQGQVKQMKRYWRHCGLCSMRSVAPPGPWLWHTDWKYWRLTCWITTGKKWLTWVPFQFVLYLLRNSIHQELGSSPQARPLLVSTSYRGCSLCDTFG